MKRSLRWLDLLLLELVLLVLLGAIIAPLLDPWNPGRVSWEWHQRESATIELPEGHSLGISGQWIMDSAHRRSIEVIDAAIVVRYATLEVPSAESQPPYGQNSWWHFPGLGISCPVTPERLFLFPCPPATAPFSRPYFGCFLDTWAVEHAYEVRLHFGLPVAILLLIPVALWLYKARKANRVSGFPVTGVEVK